MRRSKEFVRDGFKPGSTITAKIELSYIRGNSSPYFSVTGEVWEPRARDCSMCGCIHEEILAAWPDLADVVALHLSDMDGSPSHAVANGYYALAGYFPPEMQPTYHAGNSERHFPITPNPETPWRNTEYRKPTPSECLDIFARHMRCTRQEAERIAGTVAATEFKTPSQHKQRQQILADIIDRQFRARWAREAGAIIEKYGLEVSGDVRAWEERKAAQLARV